MTSITVTGLEAMQARLRQMAAGVPLQAGAALRAEAEIEMTEAKRRTPVDTGALRGSGHVTGPTVAWRDIAVVLAFGGVAAGYAIVVHEDLAAFHPRGQAKFLESVIRESAPHMAARVARRMARTMGGGV